MKSKTSHNGYAYGSISTAEPADVEPSFGSSDLPTTTSNTSSSLDTSTKCSMFESTCNMLSVITGSGMLALPYAAKETGWSALLLCLGICFVYMYTFFLIGKTVELLIKGGFVGKSETKIDYESLSNFSFGKTGALMVSCSIIVELGLALVSLYINIGINVNIVNSDLSPTIGILAALAVSLLLSTIGMKMMAYSSALGVAMTSLTLVALLLSFLWMPAADTNDSVNSSASTSSFLPSSSATDPVFHVFQARGLPVSFGIIAFCFGGHGAFPAIYQSMVDTSRSKELVAYSGIAIYIIYAFIMSVGYFTFAQFTRAPITMNIGRDHNGADLTNGSSLRSLAALGIIFNLTVTCPLITIPIRDLISKLVYGNHSEISNNSSSSSCCCCSNSSSSCSSRIGNFEIRQQTFISWLILVTASIIAYFFQTKLEIVMSFIGSLATTWNSVVLPILFYHIITHAVTKSWYLYSVLEIFIHGSLVLFAFVVIFAGVGNSICSIMPGNNYSICETLLDS